MSFCINPNCTKPNHPDNDKNRFCQSCGSQLTPLRAKQKKLHLLALFTALFVSLGLVSVVALVTNLPRDTSLSPNYGQAPKNKGKVDYFPYKEGKDSQGRTAEFNVAVLSVDYKWLLGSDSQLKFDNKIINIDALRNDLEQEGIQMIMENPTEIISVGTAACEGTPQIGKRTAFKRAKQIQLLVKKLFFHLPSVKGYRLLNLGQFHRDNCQGNQDLTAYQRSMIIIGVRNQTEGVILDEALYHRLKKKPFADFKLEDYSLGSVEKFRTIPSNF